MKEEKWRQVYILKTGRLFNPQNQDVWCCRLSLVVQIGQTGRQDATIEPLSPLYPGYFVGPKGQFVTAGYNWISPSLKAKGNQNQCPSYQH